MPNITPDLGSIQISLSGITGGVVIWLIILLVIAYIAMRIISFALSQAAEVLPYYRTWIKMIIPFAKIFIYILVLWNVIGIVASPQIGFTEIITFFGVSGAILAFGIKDLFADFVGGIVIMVKTPFQIGHKVTFGDHYGEVTDIGLRSTRLLTPDDSQVSVPNYSIFTDPTTSNNTGNLTMHVVTDIYIDARCPAEPALRIAREPLPRSTLRYLRRARAPSFSMISHSTGRSVSRRTLPISGTSFSSTPISRTGYGRNSARRGSPPKVQVLSERPDDKRRKTTALSRRSEL